MRSIIKAIEKRTNEHPDKLLFAFLDSKLNIKESYSYKGFEQRSRIIAAHINANYKLNQGDRVLLAYPAGLEMIAAFFACVRLGLIPVPVYPPSAQGLNASVQKMNFIADDCQAKAVLTDRSCYWSYKVNIARNKTGISSLTWIVSEDAIREDSIDFTEVHQEILFLQYTSGSTNEPKGVIVTHENIIQNCNNVVDHLPVGVSWLPQYHDMGLIGYYLFFAIKGGTTYGFSPSDFIQRPALWLEAITKFNATASSAPNFAYEYCLQPGKINDEVLKSLDLSSLQFLMNAAEPIKPDVYSTFLKKFKSYGLKNESFFGAYGLAEFTLAVSNYGRKSNQFEADLLKIGKAEIVTQKPSKQGVELMSCGQPLDDTEIRIINTEAGNVEVSKGQIGEIWLNGTSKAKGYWNRPELTSELFEAKVSDSEKLWLRTGDLGFIYEEELYVCGRIKDLIIIRGSNYYPQDIEAIVEKNDLVRSACVVAFAVEKSGKDSLVVVVGLKNNRSVPDAKGIQLKVNQIQGINISEIVFVPARTIPKTSSGKIRRNDSKLKYLNNELQIISREVFDENAVINESGSRLQNNYSSCSNLLNRYKLLGTESCALGDAGLDSMKLAEFGHDLKVHLEKKGYDDLSSEVDLKLLQRIAVSELFEILKDLDSASRYARFKFRQAFSGILAEYNKAEKNRMIRDNFLPDFKSALKTQSQKRVVKGNTLLTGGTGFFGPFLISSLLEQTNDIIYVLLRADSENEGIARLRKAFMLIDPSDQLLILFDARVKVICGDLSSPKLGLSDQDWSFLSESIHSIYHNGAYVNYMMDYEAMRQINVEGTKAIIELALTGNPKILNHVSTTFIFGWSVKDTLHEKDCNSAMEFLDFGYSQSKWVSDQIVLKAMEQGLQVRIFRPALISPSVDGKGYNFDISIRLLSFMLKYGIGTNARNQVSFTPADIAANNIVAISNLDSSVGKTFHVTRDQYSTMEDVTNILGELAGKSFKNYDLKNFVPEVVSRCQKNDLLFPLLNFLVRSVDNIIRMEFKRYDNDNYRKYRDLSAWGKEDPSLNEVVKGIYLFMQNNNEIAESLEIKPELISESLINNN